MNAVGFGEVDYKTMPSSAAQYEFIHEMSGKVAN